MQQIARVRRDDGRSENFVGAFCRQNFGEPYIFAFHHRTIDIFERHNEQIVIDTFLLRIFFAEANVSNFRICVRAPRHYRIIHFLPQKLNGNENVLHDHTRLRIGDVCE
jgi:hypothetical protein